MRRHRGFNGLIAASALVIGAAACSGGDADRASPGTRASTPTTIAATASTAVTVTTGALVTNPDQLHAPADATAVAHELVRVERALRQDGPDVSTRLALGWAQQLAYGALASHPEWFDAVVGALPADVDPVARANYDAARHLTSPDLGPVPDTLPDWTIRVPRPPAELLAAYHEAESASGVPWFYLAAIHLVESRMGRIHGNSGAGAQGPMQFIPSTWAIYGHGGDVYDDRDAILAAGRFLADNGGATDIERALYAYNPSQDYVVAIVDYARTMAADARTYDGYYAWQVYVTTTAGTQRLPEGWRKE